MITEDYVSFEVAKLLKDKGFDSPCMGRYSVRSKEFHLDCTKMCNNGGLFECAAKNLPEGNYDYYFNLESIEDIFRKEVDSIAKRLRISNYTLKINL